jgi:transposase-like protein
VILLAVRWYLRYGLSYRDLEELLAERGIDVDHVTLFRWVQRFTPELIDAARPCRHQAGDRWFVDETYVRVAGIWRYVYRAIDQRGQVIGVFVGISSSMTRARAGPRSVMTSTGSPWAVRAWVKNCRAEAASLLRDHGRLKARLRPMRGMKTDRTANIVIRGHAFVQNLRRGRYELGSEAAPAFRLATAFDELQLAI